jgi:DNA-3-methyladenine glycosylase
VSDSAAPAKGRRARRPPLGPALPASFYARETELVARELLGAVLECRAPDGAARGRIVETEAYLGPHDAAAHSAAGLTERNRHLHGPPGMAYVYFIYGVHWCVNAVTREAGWGSAVLIRALEPIDGVAHMRRRRGAHIADVALTNGPGKRCQALGVDGRYDGTMLTNGPLRILRGSPVVDADVDVTTRIGIRKAADLPLRWLVKSSPYVSGTRGRGGSR